MDRIWTPDNNFNFHCLKCGSRLKDHYQHSPICFEVCGDSLPTESGDVTILLPQFWQGCPEVESIWF